MNLLLSAFLVVGFPAQLDDEPPGGPKLAIDALVACSKINGYDDFVALKEAVRTREEKLLVYYEPGGFSYENAGKEYRVHFVQHARIRRRGERKVLQAKDKIVEYQGKSKTPPLNVFLANTIDLKPFPPGEYDLEIILHDEIGKGPPATRILPFRIKATADPDAEPPGRAAPEGLPEGSGRLRR